MAIASMTGFARAEGASDPHRWHWEIRSVNARGLDIRLRLPSGFERLEPVVREQVRKTLARGAVSATLSMHRVEASGAVRINRVALEAILAACTDLVRSGQAAAPRADGLMALKGVVETDDEVEDDDARAALDAALSASFADALHRLVEMRRREGIHLNSVLLERLDEIESLTAAADANLSRTPETIGRRLAEQVDLLLTAAPALDPQRLHQEAVLLATKADIREELDRLDAHVAAARTLLEEDGAIGRKLDFLTQEFNREANTICSKSNDVALTRTGLALKSVVDQVREQVQNVE